MQHRIYYFIKPIPDLLLAGHQAPQTARNQPARGPHGRPCICCKVGCIAPKLETVSDRI